MQIVPDPCQANPHTGPNVANDLALIVICCVGAGHPRAVSPGRRRVPVSLHHHRQVHQVVKINKQSAVKFIKSVICRLGVLNRIITNNKSQFTSGTFQGYCEDLGIQICYASVAHLESNG
jgi:hypothetical protein